MYKVFFILCFVTLMLLVVSCGDDILQPEEETLEPTSVPCNISRDEVIDQYSDTLWAIESINQFIQGNWRLYGIQGAFSDTLRSITMLEQSELRFSDSTLEVYEPYDSLRGTTEFTIGTSGPNINGVSLYFLDEEEDFVIFRYASGRLIPCNADLIFFNSYKDGPDRFYRKVE